jgi:hypothetical protein
MFANFDRKKTRHKDGLYVLLHCRNLKRHKSTLGNNIVQVVPVKINGLGLILINIYIPLEKA